MSRKKVVVLGGNFGGLTAALAVKHELHGDVDVTVVSASDRFLFNPSLIWLPFGKRTPSDITFPLAPTFENHDVEFVHAEATALDLPGQKVATTAGSYDYDYLVIATGYRNNFDAVEGLGPDGNAYTITTLDDAIHAGEGWRRFLDAPGDIVVGATEGAGCFGAAYEYLFNVSHQLRKAGLKKRVKLTWSSASTARSWPNGRCPFAHAAAPGAFPPVTAPSPAGVSKPIANDTLRGSLQAPDQQVCGVSEDRHVHYGHGPSPGQR
jgi:sulfide:quinone oxidoreductase